MDTSPETAQNTSLSIAAMVKVGLFAGFAISASLAVAFLIGRIVPRKFPPFYSIVVPQVDNLHTYDPVTYNGVTVGHVISVGLTQVDGAPKTRITINLGSAYVKDVLVNDKTTYGTLGALRIVSQGGIPLTPEQPSSL